MWLCNPLCSLLIQPIDCCPMVPIYILHLQSNLERARHVNDLKHRLPGPVAVHPAIDGKNLPDDVIKRYVKRGFYSPQYPFPMMRGEIACFLSYRDLWSRIIHSDADAALILEDDVEFESESFADAVQFALSHIDEFEYVQLSSCPPLGRVRTVKSASRMRICECETVPLRMWCQLVGRQAAAQLLRTTEQFDRPVDSFLQLRHVTEQSVFTLYPAIVSEIGTALGGSTIQGLEGSMPWLEREWKRMIYRYRLRRHSKEHFCSKNPVESRSVSSDHFQNS